jgi:hypothetical protein
VSVEREPITPFISRLPALAARGVSCILVIGGTGQYFDVAGELDVIVAGGSGQSLGCHRHESTTEVSARLNPNPVRWPDTCLHTCCIA